MKFNVKQLKAECKKKGIKGYSKMKKAQLETHCLNKEQLEKQKKVQKKVKKKVQKKVKSMTVKQLKAECKRKGIKGYSKMKKAQLQNHCLVQNGGSNLTESDIKKFSKIIDLEEYEGDNEDDYGLEIYDELVEQGKAFDVCRGKIDKGSPAPIF